jgi:predicted RNA-binding Zn-ribbon protein involved in translation (DUF1610 family)
MFEKPKPLLNPDGTIFQCTPKVNGVTFKCECGCKVLHVPDSRKLNTYKCNACGTRYEGEMKPGQFPPYKQ